MGKKGFLGEFEQIVLLALVRLGPNAQGTQIYDEIADKALNGVSIAAVYVTLSRLEKKGYVSSTLGEPTPVRGGRARKHFVIEGEGVEALRRSRDQIARFWDGVDLDYDAEVASREP